ncbi:hypothetical protein ABEB36_006921 [Hypothenemus hampei]|uniref:Peroxisomal leader peptide-processing protease n=1 Tax=Hypothenemus hampei TaxID=57062 RepID=A0ABD1ES80_HYPHA
MEIKPILIEINESSFLHTTSGILIGEKYILTTSHIFGNVFPGKNEIFSKIPTGKFVSLTRKSDANFSIVEENSNKTKAILFGVFKCEGLLSEFKDWSPGDKNEMNSVNLKENISLFVFLTISNERVNQEHFKSILHTWLLNIYREKIQKLDRVLCVSTPFGSRDFLNSFSQGIVSTTLKNGSLYLSDCASAPGCEGGIVHINGKPVGIILSSFNWWRKDWVGFTLIGDLRPILSGLVFNNRLPMSSVADTFSKLEQIFQNSLVQINCGVNWGTGILLSKDKRVFMTNSHVVRMSLHRAKNVFV